jgi:hypothetical protein
VNCVDVVDGTGRPVLTYIRRGLNNMTTSPVEGAGTHYECMK